MRKTVLTLLGLLIMVLLFQIIPLVGPAIIAGLLGVEVLTRLPAKTARAIAFLLLVAPFVLGAIGLIGFKSVVFPWYLAAIPAFGLRAAFKAPAVNHGLVGARAFDM